MNEPIPVVDDKMYGNLMSFVAPQQADGAVERPEFNPSTEGWPDMLEGDNRVRLERYVMRRVPEKLKVTTAKGDTHIVFADERGRAVDCKVEDVSDEQLLQLAKILSGKTTFRPQTSRTDHGYPQPQQEDVESLEEAHGWHNGAQADVKVKEAYNLIVGLKNAIDNAADVDKKIYRQIMKTMDSLSNASKETHQLMMMIRKA